MCNGKRMNGRVNSRNKLSLISISMVHLIILIGGCGLWIICRFRWQHLKTNFSCSTQMEDRDYIYSQLWHCFLIHMNCTSNQDGYMYKGTGRVVVCRLIRNGWRRSNSGILGKGYRRLSCQGENLHSIFPIIRPLTHFAYVVGSS